MFCWKCGNEIADDTKYCRFCGAKTKRNTTSMWKTWNYPIWNKKILWGRIATVFLFLYRIAILWMVIYLVATINDMDRVQDWEMREMKEKLEKMENKVDDIRFYMNLRY